MSGAVTIEWRGRPAFDALWQCLGHERRQNYVPPDAGRDAVLDVRRLHIIDQWRDTSPRRAVRSDDLPLYEPSAVRLSARRDGDAIVASLSGGPEAVAIRREGEGTIEGEGREVRWRPDSPADDTLRVAVRSRGGLAVVGVRARAVAG